MLTLTIGIKEKKPTRLRHAKRVLINAATMQESGIAAGDLLLVRHTDLDTNKGSIYKSAWPSFLGDPDILQVSESDLINCKAKIGDQVSVEKVISPPPSAKSIKVAFTSKCIQDDYTKEYLKEVFADTGCISANQIVDVQIDGRNRRVQVKSIELTEEAKGAVTGKDAIAATVLRNSTEITIVDKDEELATGSDIDMEYAYNLIGGLDKEVHEVRTIVEASLRKSQIYAEYGIMPPRGILLFGPPGTGKTLIARAVAAESNAFVHIINGAEVVNKYYGDAEEKLRGIFEQARAKSPSVIFIDEIDSLCPKRDESEGETGKRIVATLLTLMDGVSEHANDKLVVIAATNRPNSIDPALRRPGRFDREIEIPIPTPAARLQIIQKKLSEIPNTLTCAQIKSIADQTHGFVGADIDALVREAAIIVIKRYAKQNKHQNIHDRPGEKEDSDVPGYSQPNSLEISYGDISETMRLVRPSTMREVMLEIPNVRWEDIGGQDETKQLLKESVEWPLKHPEAFQRMGIRPPKGVLLYGPPGCSKTLTAKALATEAGLNFIAVRGPELFSKWVGESEKAVREIFRKARAAAPSIVFFDEIDALTVKRGASGDGTSVADRVLSQLLTELDGIEPLVNVTVVAATNRPDVIDAGILRPDRIDRLIYVGPPDHKTRKAIFDLQFRKMSCADNISTDDLATKTEGFSGAEVVSLCQEAAMEAMEEDINAIQVEARHFDKCLCGFKKRITAEMIQFYNNFRDKSR